MVIYSALFLALTHSCSLTYILLLSAVCCLLQITARQLAVRRRAGKTGTSWRKKPGKVCIWSGCTCRDGTVTAHAKYQHTLFLTPLRSCVLSEVYPTIHHGFLGHASPVVGSNVQIGWCWDRQNIIIHFQTLQ